MQDLNSMNISRFFELLDKIDPNDYLENIEEKKEFINILQQIDIKDYNLNPQQLISTISIMENLKYNDANILHSLVKLALPQLQDFNSDQLMSAISSIPNLGFYDTTFTKNWLDVAASRLGSFDTSNLVMSIGLLGDHYSNNTQFVDLIHNFVSQWMEYAIPQLNTFTPDQLFASMISVSELNYYDVNFISNVIVSINNQIEDFEINNLICIIEYLAEFNYYDQGLAQNVANVLSQNNLEADLEILANINNEAANQWITSLSSNNVIDYIVINGANYNNVNTEVYCVTLLNQDYYGNNNSLYDVFN